MRDDEEAGEVLPLVALDRRGFLTGESFFRICSANFEGLTSSSELDGSGLPLPGGVARCLSLPEGRVGSLRVRVSVRSQWDWLQISH